MMREFAEADPRQVDAFQDELTHERAMLAIHENIERLAKNAKISIGVRLWLAERAVEAALNPALAPRLQLETRSLMGFVEAIVDDIKHRARINNLATIAGLAKPGATIQLRRPVQFQRTAQIA